MAVTFRASAISVSDASSPCTVAAPGGLASGDMMLLHVHLSDNIAPSTVPSGFQLVDSITGTNNIYVYWKTAGGSEPGTYDVTFASGSCSVGMSAYQSTLGLTIAIDDFDQQTNASGDRIFPSVTTNYHDYCVAFLGSVTANVSSTPPASPTSERYDSGNPRIYLLTESFTPLGATGTRTATGTTSASKCISVVMVETPQGLRLSGSGTGTSAASTSVTITKPSGVAENDFMMIAIAVGSSITVTSVPSGWSLIDSVTGADGIYIYSKTAGGSEPADYTFQFSGSVTTRCGIVAWRSLDAVPIVVDVFTQRTEGTTGTTDRIAASVTTTRADTILHNFFVMSGSDLTLTPPSGMTQRFFSGSATVTAAAVSQEVAAIGATGTRTSTGGTTTNTYHAITIAIAESGTVYSVTLDGTITPAGSLTRTTGKVLAGAIAPAGGLAKTITIVLAGAFAPVGALARTTTKALSGVVSFAGGLVAALDGGGVIIEKFRGMFRGMYRRMR